MAKKRNRYQEMEQLLTAILVMTAVVFLIYLIAAGTGTVWLKILSAVLIFLSGIGSLSLLYLSKELLRQRSLWLTSGFFCLILCTLVSLILAFP